MYLLHLTAGGQFEYALLAVLVVEDKLQVAGLRLGPPSVACREVALEVGRQNDRLVVIIYIVVHASVGRAFRVGMRSRGFAQALQDVVGPFLHVVPVVIVEVGIRDIFAQVVERLEVGRRHGLHECERHILHALLLLCGRQGRALVRYAGFNRLFRFFGDGRFGVVVTAGAEHAAREHHSA